MTVLRVPAKPTLPAYGPLLVVQYINSNTQKKIDIDWFEPADKNALVVSLKTDEGVILTNVNSIIRYCCRLDSSVPLYGSNILESTLIDSWIDSSSLLSSTDFNVLNSALHDLDHHLTLRTFLVGYKVTAADLAVWGALRASPIFQKSMKGADSQFINMLRWYKFIGSQHLVEESVAVLYKQIDAINKAKKDQGNFALALTNAKMGEVVTRFPPEPSGYLHIGHTKAALLNQYFAEAYKGKLIVRFDDTNPSKEKVEFEDSIKEDLALIGVKADRVTHTSDYFDLMIKYAEQLLKQGDGYIDDTDQETMRAQRMDGIASRNRDLSVEENFKRWEEMKKATEFGLKCCLRAKMSVDSKNKALRDPVFFRCNLLPHHRTGTKYKIYPTYDFACPIVDSIEGVTHALRTNEYHDRNPQYQWVIEKLGLREVHIWDYSRMNFVYTLLSKRKLQWFVDNGHVTGWDDPRFPTVRGILRRGLTIEALKQYILIQGASTNTVLYEWDKLWALNKKIIDPIAPRHTALNRDAVVPVTIQDGPTEVQVKEVAAHKKNPAVGMKKSVYSNRILIASEDANELEDNEEITMMDWGNMIVKSIEKDAAGKVKAVSVVLNLQGDFKKTKKKLTWLADPNGSKKDNIVCQVMLHDYDYLITKKKLEEDDSFEDCLTPVTEFKTPAIGDYNLTSHPVSTIIQLERRGYYIIDKAYSPESPVVHLIYIPDGKVASLASKASNNPTDKKVTTKGNGDGKKSTPMPSKKNNVKKPMSNGVHSKKGQEKKSVVDISNVNMYKVKPVYASGVNSNLPEIDPKSVCKMYTVKNVYGKDFE